jgi:hypothetical protein
MLKLVRHRFVFLIFLNLICLSQSTANLVSIKVDNCKEAITEVAVVNIAINYPFDKGLALNNPKNDLLLMQVTKDKLILLTLKINRH